jgi:hypothetical protein
MLRPVVLQPFVVSPDLGEIQFRNQIEVVQKTRGRLAPGWSFPIYTHPLEHLYGCLLTGEWVQRAILLQD